MKTSLRKNPRDHRPNATSEDVFPFKHFVVVTFEFGQVLLVAVKSRIQTGHFPWIVGVETQPVFVISLCRHDEALLQLLPGTYRRLALFPSSD